MPFRLQPFGHREALALQLIDAGFIARDDGPARGFDDVVEQRADLLFDVVDAAAHLIAQRVGLLGALVPGTAEHIERQLHQSRGRLHFGEQPLELAFQHVAADRLARALAALVEARVIRVLRARLALRPRGGQRLAAVAAEHEAAQRKVLAHIGARGQLAALGKPRLDALERLQGDKRLMPCLAQGYAPFGPLQVSRVKNAGEDAVDGFVRHRAEARLGELGEAFEEALHFSLGLEAPGGEAFHGFRDDGRQRFVAQQHLSLTGGGFVAVTGRTSEGPIAIEQPCPLAVVHLLRVLLALVLRDRGEQVLDQDGIGVLAELDGRAFQPSAPILDGAAQIEVSFDVARQARDVIDDDDRATPAFPLPQIGQQLQHAGPIDQAAGNGFVLEHADDRIPLHARELAAAGFLRGDAVPLGDLRRA